MKKWFLLPAVLFLFASFGLPAQSNEVIDILLETERTSFGQAVYLALTAAGRVADDVSPEQAVAALADQGWKYLPKAPEEPVTLGEYSFLLMQAFEMKGGLMYRLFPSPRYAGRELAYLRLIKGGTSPYRSFSGEEAVGILSRLLAWKEARS